MIFREPPLMLFLHNCKVVTFLLSFSDQYMHSVKNKELSSPDLELLPLSNGVRFAKELYCNLTDNTIWHKSYSISKYSNYTPPPYGIPRISLHLGELTKEWEYDKVAVVLLYNTNIYHYMQCLNTLLRFLHSSNPKVLPSCNADT